ncbi:MAG: DUF5320 domain-containing protein [Velocimicrobium sp.]
MPRRDGTGPIGMGTMTEGRAGFCNSDFDNRDLGRCFGGYGNQRGYRRQFAQTGLSGYLSNNYPQDSQDTDKKVFLETQKTRLETQLKLVKERLSSFNNPVE